MTFLFPGRRGKGSGGRRFPTPFTSSSRIKLQAVSTLSHNLQVGNPKEVDLPMAIAHGSKPSSNPDTSKLCLSRHQHWQVQGSAHHTGHSVLAVVFGWLGWGAILPTQEDICKKKKKLQKINNNSKKTGSPQIPSLLARFLSPKANLPDSCLISKCFPVMLGDLLPPLLGYCILLCPIEN